MIEPSEQAPEAIRAATAPPAMPPTRVKRPLSWLSGAAALLVGVLLIQSLANGSLTPVRLSGPAATSTPTPVSAQLIARPGEIAPWTIQLNSIAASAQNNVWAVGAQMGGNGGAASPLILRFDGSSWKRVHNPVSYPMSGISVLASGEAWAVGNDTILHETGGVWTVQYQYQPPAGFQGWLSSVSMVSSTEGWASGLEYSDTGQNGMLLHYLGGVWTPVSVSVPSNMWAIYGVSMLSPNEGWAAGSSNADGSAGLVLHYSGGQWSLEASGITGAMLTGVSAAGPDDAWAVGLGGPTTGIVLHCTQGACSTVSVPTPNQLGGVSMRTPNDGWIVGDGAATLRYDGQQWTKVGIVIHGEHLTGIAMTSDREGWAVGTMQGGDPAAGSALLRCHNGTWQTYTLHIPDHDA